MQITSPTEGEVLDVTPTTVSGTVSPASAVVIANGVVADLDGLGGFSAPGVDLVEGPNLITATARPLDNLSASDSVEVTLDTSIPVDYTLNRPDSVSDERMFNVGAGVLNTLDHFFFTAMNMPAGVTFTASTISFTPATGDVTAPFTIDVAVGAAVGVHMFQVEYRFEDAGDVVLATHLLEFAIEVLP